MVLVARSRQTFSSLPSACPPPPRAPASHEPFNDCGSPQGAHVDRPTALSRISPATSDRHCRCRHRARSCMLSGQGRFMAFVCWAFFRARDVAVALIVNWLVRLREIERFSFFYPRGSRTWMRSSLADRGAAASLSFPSSTARFPDLYRHLPGSHAGDRGRAVLLRFAATPAHGFSDLRLYLPPPASSPGAS